ncbi:MAG TPA: hypothetical protein DCE44_25900 [Verrucomicrobiales bacterium]|nr:hypothetical protein [Verrucomicrobiales bacterium]
MNFMHPRLLLFMAVAAFAAAGCSPAPELSVINQAPLTISNVVVSASGFSERIGSISSGGEHRVRVRPHGESRARITFDAGGRHLDSGPQPPFQADEVDSVMVNVRPNLSVTVSWEMRRH